MNLFIIQAQRGVDLAAPGGLPLLRHVARGLPREVPRRDSGHAGEIKSKFWLET